MNKKIESLLAGLEPAPLENWYRYNYFNNKIDISGSGVEEYTFQEIMDIGGFSFDELGDLEVKDGETVGGSHVRMQLASLFGIGDPNMSMITNGANEGLHLVVRSVLNAGDELITLGPCYHCHDKIALSMGCNVKKWQFSNEGDLHLNELISLISDDTKAICLNFPHNPTGRSISQEMLNQIVEIVRDKGIYLIWDAVFQELTYDSPALIDPIHSYSKTITLGTFSKAYGAPGLRFGWIIAPYDVIEACIRQKDYGNLFVAPINEFIAKNMLSKLDEFSTPKLKQASKNRLIVDDWINRENAEVSWTLPDGGVCGLLKLPPHIDDVVFCKGLLSEYGVLLVPGNCFGMPGFSRLGFGGNTMKLEKGLESLSKFLSDVG